MSELPFIDVHTVAIDAPEEAVWDAVSRVMRIGRAHPLARVLGCVDDSGFHVGRDARPTMMSLEGQHRFARYELRFVREPGRLRAETRAAFPGVKGAAYRALVIGTGGHIVATRWLLSQIKQQAERTRPGRVVRPA